MSNEAISPLRQRMIDDMTARRFTRRHRRITSATSRTFTAFLGRSPDTATSEDLRRFQLHLAHQQASRRAINARHRRAAVLLHRDARTARSRPPLTIVTEPRKAPVVLSQEEVARLLQAAPGLKYKAALSVAYGAGLRVSEVAHLKVSDIDTKRMMLRVEQGKGQRDRDVMLSPQLLELLREWWRMARPQVWLFPGQNPINPSDRASAQPRRHRRQSLAGDLQARVAAYAAAQLRHPSARAGRRHSGDPGVCSDTPSWRRPRSTPASPSTRSATSRARWTGWTSSCAKTRTPPA